ncbi:branched-chain amino acid ABC transporter permease [Arthrobacter sp. PAMC25564]|uniref:branched-chain amino acid ABC transporter permease n=1 Tax=Arthrobacter sp. PAMC25564 TaxID=2565366 RepID=UPI0010A285B8|nr:branched-chain amino acid ABC transporter permease [Arthrobacter sp. PAMC25564]QCB97980.1 branched-chain amino acid ABC transporter permease [Arthrobacter sp. PAMC25564]
MSLLIGALALGLSGGVLYGMIAFAVVWLYKCTGVVNFAQGAMATLSAFLVWNLVSEHGLPGWLAVLCALAAGAVTGILCYLLVIRINDGAPSENMLMRTLALFLLISAALDHEWGANSPYTFPKLLPSGSAFQVGGATITWLSVTTILLGLLCAVVAWVFFKKTRWGLLFLALADNADAATVVGVPVRKLSAMAWGVSGLVAVLVGVLVASSTLLSVSLTDPYLLFALAAAVLGGLDSMEGAMLGGMLVGVIDSIGTVYFGKDVATLLVFFVFLLTLLYRPRGILGRPNLQRV